MGYCMCMMEVTGVITGGCYSRGKQGCVFSWMVMGPRVTVGDLFDGLT